MLPPPTSQSREGGWCGSRRAWEFRGLSTAMTVPCPLQIPEGHLFGWRKLPPAAENTPQGPRAQSQSADPGSSLRIKTPTLGDLLLTSLPGCKGGGWCVLVPTHWTRAGLVEKLGLRANFSLEGLVLSGEVQVGFRLSASY